MQFYIWTRIAINIMLCIFPFDCYYTSLSRVAGVKKSNSCILFTSLLNKQWSPSLSCVPRASVSCCVFFPGGTGTGTGGSEGLVETMPLVPVGGKQPSLCWNSRFPDPTPSPRNACVPADLSSLAAWPQCQPAYRQAVLGDLKRYSHATHTVNNITLPKQLCASAFMHLTMRRRWNIIHPLNLVWIVVNWFSFFNGLMLISMAGWLMYTEKEFMY